MTKLRYWVQGLALIALLDFAGRLALWTYTLAGLNVVVETYDIVVIASCTASIAGCIGLILLKEWARRLLLGLLVARLAWVVATFSSMPWKEANAVGVIITAGVLLIFLLTLWLFRRARDLTATPPEFARRNWWIAIVAVCLVAIATEFVSIPCDNENPPVTAQADSSLRFFLQRSAWNLSRVNILATLGAKEWQQASRTYIGQLKIVSKEASGTTGFEIKGIPEFAKQKIIYDPYDHVIWLDGVRFQGEPFERELRIALNHLVKGTSFRRGCGGVTGEILIGQIQNAGLLLILIQVKLGAKEIERLYYGIP